MGLMNVKNWQQLKSKATGKVHNSATTVVRRRVSLVLNAAVKVSPQWSGDYAMNWTIETNQLGAGAYTSSFKVHPWQALQWWDTNPVTGKTRASTSYSAKTGQGIARAAGDAEILAMSKAVNSGLIDTIKWNTQVRLVNHAPVADFMGAVNLRNVNLIAGKTGVIAYLRSKYPNIIG